MQLGRDCKMSKELNFYEWTVEIVKAIRKNKIIAGRNITLEEHPEKTILHANYIAGGGGGGAGVVPAKVTAKSGLYYECDLYGSGIDSPATLEDQKVFVLQLNLAETLPVGSWIMVSTTQIGATGGGNVP